MSKEIKIESGISIEKFACGRGKGSKYPFQQLRVGQSFFVAKPPRDMAGSLTYARLRSPEKIFAYRGVEGGTRIWRTK